MNQKRNIIAIFLVYLFTVSCSANENNDRNLSELPPIEVSKVITENGKTVFLVDGIPFPIYGAQIRLDAFINCDKMSITDVEKYFAKGKELGVNCLEVSLCWKMIEPKENIFDFTLIDKIMEYANKYGLKIELLWFSTNMIGDSFSNLVPAYILKDSQKRFYRADEGTFSGLYGYRYVLILNDKWILERETNAVTNLFNHIHRWDNEHESKHPVITAQIHNEPDGLVRWRMDQQHFAYRDGKPLSKEAAWKMTLDALDAVGKAVKNSSYKVATRTNLISGKGINPYPEAPNAKPDDVFQLEGIDFVSFDPYKTSINEIVSETLAYASLQGNYPLIAENRGAYTNTPSLMLAASVLGGGYDMYDLATSTFINQNSKPPFDDEGVYTSYLQEKIHTDAVRTILKGLIMAAPDIAKTPTKNFAAFNIVDDNPRKEIKQQIQTTSAIISFETVKGAIGFALDRGNYLLVYATDDADFSFENGIFSEVICGRYNPSGMFIQEGISTLKNNKTLNAHGGILYKISYSSQDPLISNTIENIGRNE
ncbi:MAG: DUF4969 domain-containing protein [Dysgonamonadaceae bacterium]|nr:DUF4969 domain-containing protein [Dysgonamonadaceae bacterium]